MLAAIHTDVDTIVVVAPVTHTPPRASADAVAIPADTKRRLGLDDAPSWIVVNELNRFHWPGTDLRPIPGTRPLRFEYGMIPPGLLQQVKARVATHAAHSASKPHHGEERRTMAEEPDVIESEHASKSPSIQRNVTSAPSFPAPLPTAISTYRSRHIVPPLVVTANGKWRNSAIAIWRKCFTAIWRITPLTEPNSYVLQHPDHRGIRPPDPEMEKLFYQGDEP